MKIQKPLPGMTPEETERQLHYMNAIIMFKVMHSRGIINKKGLQLCKAEKKKNKEYHEAPQASETTIFFLVAMGSRSRHSYPKPTNFLRKFVGFHFLISTQKTNICRRVEFPYLL